MSLLGTYKDKGKHKQVLVTETSRMKYEEVNITREEAVPTAKSLDPLRCKFYSTKTRYSVNNSFFKFFSSQEWGMKTEELHTAIAPILCNTEYDVPGRAICV